MEQDRTAAELVDILDGAEIVQGIYPDGGYTLIKGEELLQKIIKTGKARMLRTVAVSIRTLDEATAIAAAAVMIDSGDMGPAEIATFQRLLDDLRRAN